jgi:hypothetical protein
MDPAYLREKAESCRHVADDLPANNPGRLLVLEIADEFRTRASELEVVPL